MTSSQASGMVTTSTLTMTRAATAASVNYQYTNHDQSSNRSSQASGTVTTSTLTMTRAATAALVNKNKTSSQESGTVKGKPYPLRQHALRNTLLINPTKPSPTKLSANEPNPSPTSSTLIKKCSVCQGIEELRSYKLNEAVYCSTVL